MRGNPEGDRVMLPWDTAARCAPTDIWTIPNLITAARLVLAVVLFVLLSWQRYLAALVAFVVAAGTDWLDGYLARRWQQVTVLGRMLDPFVDKIIICGTFIFLVAEPACHVAPWMATVIVGRELLVTALRSYMESQGVDFSASWAGKWKMVVQCLAAALCLLLLHLREPSPWGLSASCHATVWAAVLITLYSGAEYTIAAARKARREEDRRPG